MPYFDTTDAAHTALLSTAAAAKDNLAAIAARAERDVVNMFRFQLSNSVQRLHRTPYNPTDATYIIYIDTYDPDPDWSGVDADMKQALIDTVADVISYRVERENAPTGVKRERRGRREIEYAGATSYGASDFPPQWDGRLSAWDLRPKYAF